ncbi:thiamine phosphate synthase [Vibrio methylphosphonaticus]|uniref:thiamine phosphate synthase n=1 Tax=Vibrio methylphosphonaticus TaxID=2946866 RepID=UPI002029DF32|nr:thiamine phosphate synthase [Vibrio methylphosphonaticus]MCL9777383.1 thiamine phosphate synthase [Vibrio methylphosphonaticus]
MKILLPANYLDIGNHLQSILGIAKQAGFDTSSISVGTSTTTHVELVGDNLSTTVVATDLFASEFTDDVDYVLFYQHQKAKAELSRERYVAINTRIYLNVIDDQRSMDVWSCNSGSNRALTSASAIQEMGYHFSWFVVSLLLDFPVEDALVLARAGDVSRETWPYLSQHFPTPVIEDERLDIQVGWAVKASTTAFSTMSKASLGLYPVVDSVDWIRTLLELGIKTIQLRIKNPDDVNLESKVKQAIELGNQYNAQVFINDYWQLALKYQAYGVHLGQEDIETADLRTIANAGIRLGLSTHGYYELLRIVQINPSYIALGHIFPTTTKDMPSRPQGLVRLALYQKLIDTINYGDSIGYPTVAIGGIDLNTAQPVWNCGVSSLAVVRAITQADDIPTVIDKFSGIMRRH